MKILLTTDTIHRGGKERQIFILAKELIKKKCLKISILKRTQNSYLKEYDFNVNNIIYVGNHNWKSIFNSFHQVIKNYKPDFVISFDSKSSFFILILYWCYRFKFLNASIRHGIRLFKLSHLIRSFVLWLSPYTMANSNAGLKANNLKENKRNFILYNGIENKFQNFLAEREKEQKRKRLICNHGNNYVKIFISVANLVPFKDYFTVLDALKKLKGKYDFYYLILGDGPLKFQIKSKVKEYGLEGNVILVGSVDNVKDYLDISDYMIHSSRGEGLSNSILEGMFAGLPVIATNVGGTPELMYEESFRLFEYQDKEALYNILVNVEAEFEGFDPKSKDYLSHLKKFETSTMLKKFDRILTQVVNA